MGDRESYGCMLVCSLVIGVLGYVLVLLIGVL